MATTRIYTDQADTIGVVLCEQHQAPYLARHPAAVGYGERGGKCVTCEHNRRNDARERRGGRRADR